MTNDLNMGRRAYRVAEVAAMYDVHHQTVYGRGSRAGNGSSFGSWGSNHEDRIPPWAPCDDMRAGESGHQK